MRCFVAILLPDSVRLTLRTKSEELLGGDRAFRLVSQENLHLTLQFLGEVEPETVDRVRDGLRSALHGSPSQSFELGGFGAFPSAKRPRVVWAGVRRGAEGLRLLAEKARGALAPLGFQSDKRFSPHITVARARRGRRKARLPEESPEFRAKVPVSEVCLMRSVLKPSGAEYSVVEAFPLLILH